MCWVVLLLTTSYRFWGCGFAHGRCYKIASANNSDPEPLATQRNQLYASALVHSHIDSSYMLTIVLIMTHDCLIQPGRIDPSAYPTGIPPTGDPLVDRGVLILRLLFIAGSFRFVQLTSTSTLINIGS